MIGVFLCAGLPFVIAAGGPDKGKDVKPVVYSEQRSPIAQFPISDKGELITLRGADNEVQIVHGDHDGEVVGSVRLETGPWELTRIYVSTSDARPRRGDSTRIYLPVAFVIEVFNTHVQQYEYYAGYILVAPRSSSPDYEFSKHLWLSPKLSQRKPGQQHELIGVAVIGEKAFVTLQDFGVDLAGKRPIVETHTFAGSNLAWRHVLGPDWGFVQDGEPRRLDVSEIPLRGE